MTPKQEKLLSFIKSYLIENNGIAPTHEEMKEALGLKAKSNIHRFLKSLQKQGYISTMPNQPRAIEVYAEKKPFKTEPDGFTMLVNEAETMRAFIVAAGLINRYQQYAKVCRNEKL